MFKARRCNDNIERFTLEWKTIRVSQYNIDPFTDDEIHTYVLHPGWRDLSKRSVNVLRAYFHDNRST